MIPKSFDCKYRKEIREHLWGYGTKTRIAIITPISLIFNNLIDKNPTYKGWWKSGLINEDILVIHTPQSLPIIDAISSIEQETEIIFIGFSGSLGGLKVGEIVEPNDSYYQNKIYPRKSKFKLFFKNARITSVGSFAESYYFYEKLKNNADCVDMETGVIFQTCQKQKKQSRSFQIISDDFDKNIFFKKTIDFSNQIKEIKIYILENQ